MQKAIELVEAGLVPDWVTRLGIRGIVKERLVEERRGDIEAITSHFSEFLGKLRQEPLAIETAAANAQHYEVPAEFFKLVLGKHLKYSSCYFKTGKESLDQAEQDMLALTCERAELGDGQQILELGCGWGSLTLWMAAQYPQANITAVSNSKSQRDFILARAAERGLKNVEVITADINVLKLERTFDRVVSVEMFEHMKNYDSLLTKIHSWLKDNGKLFVHIFCHRLYAYNYEVNGTTNWMGRYFFTGGTMPSDHLLLYFPQIVPIEQHWRVNGRHYGLTAWHWYQNLLANKGQIIEIFEATYGRDQAVCWFNRWKVFFLACHELFSFNRGEEWFVSHYRFSRA